MGDRYMKACKLYFGTRQKQPFQNFLARVLDGASTPAPKKVPLTAPTTRSAT